MMLLKENADICPDHYDASSYIHLFCSFWAKTVEQWKEPEKLLLLFDISIQSCCGLRWQEGNVSWCQKPAHTPPSLCKYWIEQCWVAVLVLRTVFPISILVLISLSQIPSRHEIWIHRAATAASHEVLRMWELLGHLLLHRAQLSWSSQINFFSVLTASLNYLNFQRSRVSGKTAIYYRTVAQSETGCLIADKLVLS